MPTDRVKARIVLTMNTIAFTVCFSAWMMNGVLITFLIEKHVFVWDKAQIGWLIGIPVLTGSIIRLPVGVATDKYGGRVVYTIVMLLSAVPMYLVSFANDFTFFFLTGLGFGLAGTSFAVGIAYTSVWFERKHQGTALGIFGAGNAGAALTSVGAPMLLAYFTADGANLEGWRLLPRFYAAMLVAMALVFYVATFSKKVEVGAGKTLAQRLTPLRDIRVWRFGFYYFIVFGGFVALAQWLVPYYVGAYALSIGLAGLLAAVFSFPSGVIRVLGGWMSDRWGARKVMYWVLSGVTVCCLLLAVPRMDLFAPGEGVMAEAAGAVGSVTSERIVVGERSYALRLRPEAIANDDGQTLVWPRRAFWHEPVAKEGERVAKRQLLARGVTHIFFQANRGIFTGIALLLAVFMGIGMAAVYKHIPTYFPKDVGVVGGIVGVLGGLGGFFFPILFGYLLQGTGIWTTCWLFFFGLAVACLVWMHLVIQRLMAQGAPQYAREMETTPELARQMEDLAREMEGLAEKLRKPARGAA